MATRKTKMYKEVQKISSHILDAKKYYFNETINDHRLKQHMNGLHTDRYFDFLVDISNGESVEDISRRAGQTNLSWLLDELMKSSDFFPSVKQILDVAKPKEETPRDKAEAFVELMLSGLAASGNINDRVGESNYSFWKKHTGVDRFAIASGAVDPRFMRGTWIDTFEQIYKGQNVLQLVERNDELTLAGRIEPTEPA